MHKNPFKSTLETNFLQIENELPQFPKEIELIPKDNVYVIEQYFAIWLKQLNSIMYLQGFSKHDI